MASSLTRQYSGYLQKASSLYQRPQIKASLEIILSVFAVGLLLVLAIKPTLTNIASLQKKIEDQTIVLKKTDTKIGQLITAEKSLSDYQSRLYLLQNAVPDEYGYFGIVKRLEIIAFENSVILKTTRLPGSVIAGSPNLGSLAADKSSGMVLPDPVGKNTIDINFVVEGTQTQVLGFIKGIENMDMLAAIQNIRISKQLSLTSRGNVLSLDGKARFYSLTKKK